MSMVHHPFQNFPLPSGRKAQLPVLARERQREMERRFAPFAFEHDVPPRGTNFRASPTRLLNTCMTRSASAFTARVATASLIEVWLDETERRVWFLFESNRHGDSSGH